MPAELGRQDQVSLGLVAIAVMTLECYLSFYGLRLRASAALYCYVYLPRLLEKERWHQVELVGATLDVAFLYPSRSLFFFLSGFILPHLRLGILLPSATLAAV